MANTVINKTTSTGLAVQKQTYFDRKLLMETKKRLVFDRFARKIILPTNEGKTWQGRQYNDLPVPTTALTEGVNPAGLLMDQDEVTATAAEWGAFVEATSLLRKVSFDPVATTDALRLLGRNAKDAIDKAYLTALSTAGTVQFGGDATDTDEVAAGDTLTINDIQKAIRTLELADAPKFSREGSLEHYVCITSPYGVYNLRRDNDWQAPHEYVDTKNIYSGELGMYNGVVFVSSSNYFVDEGAGAGTPGIDVHSTFVFGEEAYGGVYLGSDAVRTIVHPPGSSGAVDALDMLGTIGWKLDGFVPVILHNDWLVRIEHAVA
jgi:N4-gp56 family major capsid protein